MNDMYLLFIYYLFLYLFIYLGQFWYEVPDHTQISLTARMVILSLPSEAVACAYHELSFHYRQQ